MQYKLECPTLRYSTHQLVQPLLYLLMFEWFSGSHRDELEWLSGLRRLGGFLSSVASQLTATHWRREGREGRRKGGERKEGKFELVLTEHQVGYTSHQHTQIIHPLPGHVQIGGHLALQSLHLQGFISWEMVRDEKVESISMVTVA